MAYVQKNNPFKKIIPGEGEEEGVKIKTKTKVDKDGNIIWTKTKKPGEWFYKKQELKHETPPNPMPPSYNVKPTDPGKTHQA